jgi:hypothetical protein
MLEMLPLFPVDLIQHPRISRSRPSRKIPRVNYPAPGVDHPDNNRTSAWVDSMKGTPIASPL